VSDAGASGSLESAWSDVDAAPAPERLVAGLDRLRSDPFFVRGKARLYAALELRADQRVADVGCGTGDDTAALAEAGGEAIGIDRSTRLLSEARRRHASVAFVVGDARALPLATASIDRLGVDRVVQHLARAERALGEWRRVLRPGGVIAIFEPDVTSARIEGLDPRVAERVLAWRAATRPGASVVADLPGRLEGAGFSDVSVEPAPLVLEDLARADSMMGLPDWGEAAGAAGVLDPADAARWRPEALAAAERGTLRFSTTYVLVSARASVRSAWPGGRSRS